MLQVESQMRYVEGTPLGSRGGIAVVHNFPADGDYKFTALLQRTISGELFGNTGIAMAGSNELLEISINGERAAVLEVKASMSDAFERGFEIDTPPIHVKAGPQRVAAAFVPRFVGPVDDLMMPIDHTLVDMRIGTGFGITVGAAHPGPGDRRPDEGHRHLGHAEPPQACSRCRPTAADEERGCATDTVRRLATQAFRGPVSAADMADLMKFYDQGRKDGDFENGIRMAVQGILANPRFLFRVEQQPDVPAGSSLPHRRSRAGLAAVVLHLGHGARRRARQGGDRRHAQDHRRARPAGRGGCWPTRRPRPWPPASGRSGCGCRTSRRCGPTASSSRSGTSRSPTSMRKETELFFASLVREDRSVLDLLNADYTYVERAAGPALRLPQRHRHRVPPRRRCRRPAAASSPRAAS